MPPRQRLRPLKAWRYVGVYGPELMLCIGSVRIGPARQAFWAVWDRASRRLYERTVLGRGAVTLEPGRARVMDRTVQIDLSLAETSGIETVSAAGDSYAWTRKQGGIRIRGTVAIDGQPRVLDARGVIDDTAAYYPRHTNWRWSAGSASRSMGAGSPGISSAASTTARSGASEPSGSTDRRSRSAQACSQTILSGVDGLRFTSEAVRESDENLLLIRSSYRQPFGTFSGELPGGVALAEGYGVMEEHDVWW